MSSPTTCAKSSSSSRSLAYLTGDGVDNHVIEVRSKLYPFAQTNLYENVLHLFEKTLVMGPHWFGPIPKEMAILFRNDAEALLCYQSSTSLASYTWVRKNLSRSFPSSEVRNSAVKWSDSIDRLLPRHGAHWKRAGIYDRILLSRHSINRDENLLAAALCFWNSASNTFDFRLGPMTPTLLDMAQIFGFRPHGRPVDVVGDYHRRKNQEKLAKPFTISLATINQNCSFLFSNRSFAVLLEYKHLAEALHNHMNVGLRPTILAHIYKNLHTATLENPLNLSASGAFWMIQVWLQVYFPELRFTDIVLPKDQVIAHSLMSAEVPKRSIEKYLMFFRHYTKRFVVQWQAVLRRTYPWFQPGYKLFEKEPKEEEDRIEFRKKFQSVMLPRDMPFGGGKPPNYHLGAEVYHPNFCARQLGCPQLIPLKSYRGCNRSTSWRDSNDLDVHKDCRCLINKINNSVDALYPSWEPNSCNYANFDAWWKARFQGFSASSTALKVLFDGWDSWTVYARAEAKSFMVQMIKDINAQVIEDIGSQTVHSGEVIVNSVIAAGDLELPFGDEEDQHEPLVEQLAIEATHSTRRKRKEVAHVQDSFIQPKPSAESPPPPTTRSKRPKKRIGVESDEIEEPVAVPIETSGTDDKLREAFEAVEQEKGQEEEEDVPLKEKDKEPEEEEEIPTEVIAESIALAKQHEEAQRAEPTSSELALFDDVEAEHSVTAPKLEVKVEHFVVVPIPENKIAGVLAVVTSPFKPLIVDMPIHSLLGSFTTTSFADPELVEFEAMDFDAQLDKLEKLSSTPSKAKSKAVDRLKIWESTEMDLDENQEAVDQLMKDLDLLHRENMAPRPILEISLGLARDMLNLHNRYEDLKPSFKASEFCKATHEANLVDYQKQKAKLDQMVVGYKEAKIAADKLEKQIEELQKQLAGLRERQNRLGAGLGTKTYATFFVQNMIAASKPALEIAEASLHQGMLLQQEISTKKTGLQETLRKLGF
ncbi:unnamed protein product [Prunus armeniaca]